MARNVNPAEHNAKLNEILDTAQGLVYSKGYRQMTIQDVLDGLHISKGAFYHYFGSKQALLAALIERMVHQIEAMAAPILEEPLDALTKLHKLFASISNWKVARQEFFLGLLQVWYTDDNAIVREKMNAVTAERIVPLITTVVRQGIEEGVMHTSHVDQIGSIIMALLQNLGDALGRSLLADAEPGGDPPPVARIVAVHNDALERVLGAAPGSIHLVETSTVEVMLEVIAQETK